MSLRTFMIHGGGGGLAAKSCPILATPWTVALQVPLSMGRGQNITLTGVWKKLIQIFMDDFEGFKTPMKKSLQMWQKRQENYNQKGSLKMWLNCCNLMKNLNGWGVASYEWIKKVVSWEGIYFWWRCYKLHYWLILRNCHSHLNLQQPPPWSVSNHQYQGKTFHWQKDYNLLKALMMVRSF